MIQVSCINAILRDVGVDKEESCSTTFQTMLPALARLGVSSSEGYNPRAAVSNEISGLQKIKNQTINMNRQRFYYTFPSIRPSEEAEEEKATPRLEEVGGKGLSLIETCSKGGFPVPPGLVLTVYFFEPWMAKVTATVEWSNFIQASTAAAITKEHCDAVKSTCKQNLKGWTTSQKEQLDNGLQQVFGKDVGILAVRSSSPEEDLVGKSFAGAYETTLGVMNAQELFDAIVDSFASMFDYRIVQYKLQHDMIIDKPRIAVILQRQIASDVSGVAFGINPQNNCYDEVMISANYGLGETIVSGTVTPDLYIVDRAKKTCIQSKKINEKTIALWLKKTPGDDDDMTSGGGGTHYEKPINPIGQALSDEKILEVADLVARVEDFRNDGVPVDIEWAYQRDELFLLQARPVTAYIPLFPEMITPRGERKNLYMDVIVMSQGFSEPFSVMGLDLWYSFLKKVKPQFETEGNDGLMWNLGGRQYIHMSNFLTTIGARKMMYTDPSVARILDSIDLDGEYLPTEIPIGVKGTFWNRLKHLGAMLPGMIHALFAREKAMVDYDRASEAFFVLCQDEDYMRDESLDNVLVSFLNKYQDEMISKAGGLFAAMYSSWRLNRIFSQVKDAADLLVSLKMDVPANPTSAMGHAMIRLASYPEVQQTKTGEEFVQKVKQTDGGGFSDEFMTLYNDYMKRFGCRGMKEIDVATPRTSEKEADFFQQLKQIDLNQNAVNNVTERRKEAYDKLLKMAQDIGYEKSFKDHAAIVHSLWGYREHPKYMYVVMVGMFRRRALNIGELLVKQGRLERVEQIFDLTFDQIAEAQRNPDMVLAPVIEANLKPYKATGSVKNWPIFIDSRGKIIREPRKEYNANQLWGDPISPGVVKGKARVLNEPYETPLLAGEILVARFTEPSWTPIFINAAGVVMEVGGPLQHGAVIAREYGLPCVSGVDHATTIIKNGDEIEVDGSTGVVTMLNLANKSENGAEEDGTKES